MAQAAWEDSERYLQGAHWGPGCSLKSILNRRRIQCSPHIEHSRRCPVHPAPRFLWPHACVATGTGLGVVVVITRAATTRPQNAATIRKATGRSVNRFVLYEILNIYCDGGWQCVLWEVQWVTRHPT
jgi:hypothetical protein